MYMLAGNIFNKGPFINYVWVPRERWGLEKSLHTLTLGGGEAQTHSYVIFSKSIFYIRNRPVKWFDRLYYFIVGALDDKKSSHY